MPKGIMDIVKSEYFLSVHLHLHVAFLECYYLENDDG